MNTVPSKKGRKYGYYPGLRPISLPRYGVQLRESPPPPFLDLRSKCPPVVDQQNTSSCTSNAIAGAYQFERMQKGMPPLTPSRLFIYWNERAMEGDTGQDDGAFGGDGLTSLETLGVCDESIWPFNPADVTVRPSDSAFQSALQNRIASKAVLESVYDIKNALLDNHLVPFGLTLYESFESDAVEQTGIVPVPSSNEGVLGGHEMCIVGWQDDKNLFIVRNSWGTSFGDAGYCYIPVPYVMQCGSDFEAITQI